MTAFTDGTGFGSFPCNQAFDDSNHDFLFREIRCGSLGVSIRHIRAELDAGFFNRSADATGNVGQVFVARVGILKGNSTTVAVGGGLIQPPAPSDSTGLTPPSWRQEDLRGYSMLWQATVFAYPQQVGESFAELDVFGMGDNQSLYVIVGGFKQIPAGTSGSPGSIASAPPIFATLSVNGSDYNVMQQYGGTGRPFGGLASLPRFDVSGR